MASIVQKAHATVNGGLTASLTLSGVAAGNDIVVSAAGSNLYSTGLGCSVSDGHNSYSQIVQKLEQNSGAGEDIAVIFRAQNVSGGNLTISATFTDPVNNGVDSSFVFTAYEVNGLDDTSANDGTTSNGAFSSGGSASGPLDAGSITPSASGDLIFVVSSNQQNGSYQAATAGGAFALDYAVADVLNTAMAMESQVYNSTSPVDCTFGSSPSNPFYSWAAVGAAFKAAGSGGGSSNTPTVTILNTLLELRNGQNGVDNVALRNVIVSLRN